MIDVQKVRMMTKITLCREKSDKEIWKMHRYNKRTYIGVKLIESFAALSAAYVFGVLLYLLCCVSAIMEQGYSSDYRLLILEIFAGYLLFLLVGLLTARRIYRIRYERMCDSIRKYDRQLYQLNQYIENKPG